ncbi:hypothetical protein AAHC03_026790 [Spirometra sp. Aus1]
MLQHAVSAPRSIAVAVLDVAKAFDSVNHDTRLRAAAVHAAPPLLLNTLTFSYSRTTTYMLGTEVRCLPVKLFPILIDSLGSSWME